MDVLEAPGGRRWSARRRLVVVAVVVAVLAVGAALDRWQHHREVDALSRCRAQASAAIREAAGPLWAQAALVRAALPRAGEDVRRDLYELLSDQAAAGARRLRAARPVCRVQVLWYHRDARGGRDACLAALDAQVRWYEEAARDGRASFRPHPGEDGCE